MKKFSVWKFVVANGCLLWLTGAAHAANVTFDFAGTCQPDWDCGPLGVLDGTVGAVTGTLALDLLEPTIAQNWDKNNVLSYSFTFGNFTIDDGNSTLSNSLVGNIPFTTGVSDPFTPGDGFLIATYDADNTVSLNIDLGGINLVQSSLTSCTGTCQALAIGEWTRPSAVPVPAAFWLFGSGLIGFTGAAGRKMAA